MDLIQAEARRRIASYRRYFLHAKPFKHVVIPRAFNPVLLRRIREELRRESFHKIHNEVGRASFIKYQKVKSPFLKQWLPSLIKEMLPWVESIVRMKLSRLRVEMDFYKYSRSDYLKSHKDDRPFYALVFLVYLTNFSRREGGRLMLLGNNKRGEKRMTKYVPHRFNHLVLFEAGPKSFHQVESLCTNKKRLTMGGVLFRAGWDREFAKFLKEKQKLGEPQRQSKACGREIRRPLRIPSLAK